MGPVRNTFFGNHKVLLNHSNQIKQIGTLVLAPPMIALMAAVAVPATIVGVPIYVGTTARSKLKKLRPRMTKRKRSCLVVLASSVSFILSPLVAALTGTSYIRTRPPRTDFVRLTGPIPDSEPFGPIVH